MKQNPQSELQDISDICSLILHYFDNNDETKLLKEIEKSELVSPVSIKIKKQLLQMVKKWKSYIP